MPFSYQRIRTCPSLLASVAVHALALSGLATAHSPPQFALDAAESSVEISWVEEQVREVPPPPAPPLEESVLTQERAEEFFVPASDEISPAEEERKDPVVPVEESVSSEEDIRSMPTPPERGVEQECRPDYLRNPPPAYPRLALEHGWQGLVLLRAQVRADGTAGDVVVETSSGYPVLDRAALRSVCKWRFLPARLGDVPFSSTVQVPVRFRIVEASR
ncbi:MAG: energy transducer TonB [Planctomycetes bacterium]|nr:energy transducer TonB [Planctomycetota bacterium]